MKKDLFIAIATLVGFVAGAGILGLPYVFARAGFLTGIVNIVLIGLAVMILNLMIGEISLRTKNNHQLVGYAKKYLGIKGKKLMMFLLLIGWYGALVAYTIKIGEILSAVINPLIYISPIYYSIFFALSASYLVYKGILLIEKSEFWMVLLLIITISVIGIFYMPSVNYGNLQTFSLKDFWFPFGVVLFAFGGAGAIPEMRIELTKNKRLMKHAIIIGTMITMAIYILFTLLVVGVTGSETTDGAIIGLGKALGPKMLLLGGFFGILTMSTSFLAIGLAIKEIFKFDYRNHNLQSSLFACIIPFVFAITIIMLNIDNAFYKVINFAGVFIYPLTSIMFILIFWHAKKKGDRKPEYSMKFSGVLGAIIILLFLASFVNGLRILF